MSKGYNLLRVDVLQSAFGSHVNCVGNFLIYAIKLTRKTLSRAGYHFTKALVGKLAPVGIHCTEKGALKTLVKWHPDFHCLTPLLPLVKATSTRLCTWIFPAGAFNDTASLADIYRLLVGDSILDEQILKRYIINIVISGCNYPIV